MPPKGNPKDNTPSGRKRSKKRVASSPLIDNSEKPEDAQTTFVDSGLYTPKQWQNVNVPKSRSLPATPNMAFSPGNNQPFQVQFPGQIVPTGPGTGFVYQACPQEQPVRSNEIVQPPTWATELIKDVKQIKESMRKIETIEKTVNMINMKVTNLEDKVKSIDNRVTEVENSSSFLAEQSDVCNQTLNSTKTELKKMKKIYDDLENEAKKIEERRTQMEDKLTDLECRSMRDNLIFYGIPETAAEDCENKVKELCKEKLGILNADTFVFDRVHRLGSEQNTRKPRPVVVKFHLYKEREIVRNKSFERETSDRLRRENLGVGVQWPKQVREARRELRPIYKKKNVGNLCAW